MGRRTFESIGRALPGRTNLVLTSRTDFEAEGCIVVRSIEEARRAAGDAEELMVIGGARLYEECLPLADRLHLTEIGAEVDGDTYFPVWRAGEWLETARIEREADGKHEYDVVFRTLERTS